MVLCKEKISVYGYKYDCFSVICRLFLHYGGGGLAGG